MEFTLCPKHTMFMLLHCVHAKIKNHQNIFVDPYYNVIQK